MGKKRIFDPFTMKITPLETDSLVLMHSVTDIMSRDIKKIQISTAVGWALRKYRYQLQ
jgi:hypothetical protein